MSVNEIGAYEFLHSTGLFFLLFTFFQKMNMGHSFGVKWWIRNSEGWKKLTISVPSSAKNIILGKILHNMQGIVQRFWWFLGKLKTHWEQTEIAG